MDQQERLETYSRRVVSRLKLAVMQLYTVRTSADRIQRAVIPISEISKSGVSIIINWL